MNQEIEETNMRNIHAVGLTVLLFLTIKKSRHQRSRAISPAKIWNLLKRPSALVTKNVDFVQPL